MEEEQVIFDGKLPFTCIWASGGLLSFLLFGWNIGLLLAWIKGKQFSLKITSQRIEYVQGILSTNQESIELYRANDSEYSQSILQKLFGVGSITIISADSTARLVSFPMKDPSSNRDKIRNFIRDERQRMGTTLRENG